MKRIAALLLLAATITLTGCTKSLQPEHQAYAISMSVDLEDDGQITVGIQAPSMGAPSMSSGEGEGEGSGTNESSPDYVLYASTGASYPEALDMLRVTVSRRLKLSQLESVIFNEKLARSPQFWQVIDQMVMTQSLSGTAIVVMCRGNAHDFLKKQRPTIGAQLSTSVSASLENYFASGYVVLTSLSELYAANHSIYSDPVIAVAANANTDDLSAPPIPPDNMGEVIAGEIPRESNTENEYMGCALMLGGSVVDLLNGNQCEWLEIITSRIDAANYSSDGAAMRLSVTSGPHFTIDLHEDAVDVSLSIGFECTPLTVAPDLETLKEKIRSEIDQLIRRCQAAGVEPFNLGELAAAHFLTIPDYQRYGFREKFCAADVAISVDVSLYTS